MKCFSCNKKMSEKIEQYHYKESGLDNVYLETPVFRCNKCKEVIADIPAIDELHMHITIGLIKKDSMLAGKEIKFLRKQMGLKANELANILGVTKQTVSRWENEKEKTSQYNDKLTRMICIQLLQEKCDKVFKAVLKNIKAIHPSVKRRRINIPHKKLKEVCDLSTLAAM